MEMFIMPFKFVERDDFYIGGCSVETTLVNSSKDIALLFQSCENKNFALKEAEHYGLMWYTQGHERYRYLVGKETPYSSSIPIGLELKHIPKALFAVASYPHGYDNTKAWTDFFFTDIPTMGYTPNYEHGYFFEYYPNGAEGDFELWTPVEKVKEN